MVYIDTGKINCPYKCENMRFGFLSTSHLFSQIITNDMVERDFSDISDTIAQIMLDGTLLGPGNDDYSDEEYY